MENSSFGEPEPPPDPKPGQSFQDFPQKYPKLSISIYFSDVDPNPYLVASLDPNPKFNTDSGFGSKGTKMIIFKSEPEP